MEALRKYNESKCQRDEEIMFDFKLRYKRPVKFTRRCYENRKTKQIENLRHAKPREFWKLFAKRKTDANENVNIDDFFLLFFQFAKINTYC